MKNFKLSCLQIGFASVFFTSYVFSQHSERFVELTKNIKSIDSTIHKNYYSNDSLKDIGLKYAYKTSNYTYWKKSAKHKSYYRTGELKSEVTFDRFENQLNAIFYNLDGTTWWVSTTLQIDTNLKNEEDFFDIEHSILTKKIKEYRFGSNVGKTYLKSHGTVVGNKKVGLWHTYDQYGAIENETNYGKI